MGAHARCLLLMTRGEGGGQKSQKPAYVIHGCSLIWFRLLGLFVSIKSFIQHFKERNFQSLFTLIQSTRRQHFVYNQPVLLRIGTLKSVCSSCSGLISRDKYEHTHFRLWLRQTKLRS